MSHKKIIIFGNSSFSIMMAEYIQNFTDKQISCFTVNETFINGNELLGLPVIPFEKLVSLYSPSEYSFFIALGYTKMNTLRENIFNDIIAKGFKIESFVHPTANINADNIGIGNIFLENAFIGPHSQIGNGNIFWSCTNISHDTNIGNFNFFAPSSVLCGNIKVNNNCFFGANCTIKNGISIANKTLIGAGCYLNHNSSPEDVYVPASTLKLDIKSEEFI